jgi:Uma2 family endonuclease
MLTATAEVDYELVEVTPPPVSIRPNIDHLITEDDEPVDNIFSAKQQRLLVEPLYSAWQDHPPFLADANVGLFYGVHQNPLVPDAFLSLGVHPPSDWWAKHGRSYFLWEFGKPPEVVVEIVSNNKGGEAVTKLKLYAQIGVPYYAIFDPQQQIQPDLLRLYQLNGGRYRRMSKNWLSAVGLGLILWSGVYEDGQAVWLRWCDAAGKPIPTGAELVLHTTQLLDEERQRAEQERQRADQAEQQLAQLMKQLQAMGVDPSTLANG